ncbi:class I SAM-dependent methyltransferase [Paenibacillus sp. TRM 82003]|nr:class I SAM-dependent methyltransferase [Paenibacillus sp. TRM 82003]
MGNTDIFEAMAEGYDTSDRIEAAKIAANAIREYIEDGKEKDAVDFGCGTGLVGMQLLDDFRHIVFLDTSRNMLDQITRKLSDANVQHADTLCFDFETGVTTELRADYVFMSQVLLHIKDVEHILSRLYEVLRPGGHLLIVDFDKNDRVISDKVHNGFDRAYLVDLMTRIGYTHMKSRTIHTGSKLFMNQDASLFIMDAKK